MIRRIPIPLAYGLFLAAFLFRAEYAKPSGTDRGLLFLSSATYMFYGERNPVTQRGPLYPALLAGIGFGTGRIEGPAEEVALEFGNPDAFQIERFFLQPRFLRYVLYAHVLLFLFTVLVIASTLKKLGLPGPVRFAALGMYLVIACGTPIHYVHELVLTQFLISGTCYFLVKTLQSSHDAAFTALAAGLCAALSGLSRPTYQALGIALAFFLVVIGIAQRRLLLFMNRAVLVIIPTLILIGGWSLRNWNRHGFFGVSSVLGSTLGARRLYTSSGPRHRFPASPPSSSNCAMRSWCARRST